MSEPAILVRRLNNSSQIWSMEKLENKLIDMREMYEECKDRASSPMVSNIVLRAMLLLSFTTTCVIPFPLVIYEY